MVIRLGPGVEFDLIRAFVGDTHTTGPDVRVGPGDDCAVVTGGVAVTVDMAVEDVHFRRAWLPMTDIGYHAATGALSDLAAVAARPIGILASVALGPGDEESVGYELMEGVVGAVRAVDGALLGGDLTRSPGPLVLDITALGEVSEPVLRTGARPGDEVWVTGVLGGAAAAVERWLADEDPDPSALRAWARPTARTREALWLAERGLPSAMVDLSDGLVGDAGHIAAASEVRVVIRAAALPVAGSALGGNAIGLAAAGGEDYELCFTARPGVMGPASAEFREEFGVALTRVGTVEEGSGAVVLDDAGRPIELKAFQHWEAQ